MEMEEKKLKPFLNKTQVVFTVQYKDNQYTILVKKDYTWDGATIPFGFRWIIGAKGSPQFLIPSMVHDILCENKNLINHNRKLSSLVFKELLVACGSTRAKAHLMYLAVDNFQKFCGWEK